MGFPFNLSFEDPKKVILPLEMSFTDTEMEMIGFAFNTTSFEFQTLLNSHQSPRVRL